MLKKYRIFTPVGTLENEYFDIPNGDDKIYFKEIYHDTLTNQDYILFVTLRELHMRESLISELELDIILKYKYLPTVKKMIMNYLDLPDDDSFELWLEMQ